MKPGLARNEMKPGVIRNRTFHQGRKNYKDWLGRA